VSTVIQDDEYEDRESADIVASGYETACPNCDHLVQLIEVPRYGYSIVCICGYTFKTSLPEHAYA